MFTLNFDTDNSAFADGHPAEVARILSDVAGAVEAGCLEGRVFDSNGNGVGYWNLSAPAADQEG